MRKLWIALAPLALAVGAGGPAWGQALTFPFTCELDLNTLRDVDILRNVPATLRLDENGDPVEALPAYVETGEKKCTPGAVSQIRCETEVEDWPNPRNITIKVLRDDEVCQWHLSADDCGVAGKVEATNFNFKIKRVNSNTASLELFCTSNNPPVPENGG